MDHLNVGGLFALLAAIGYSLFNIFNRKGMMNNNPGNVWDIRLIGSFSTLIVFCLGVVILAFFDMSIIQEFKHLNMQAVLLLLLSGVSGSFVGALLITMAVSQIGASQTSVLYGGSNPLFAVLLSIVLLSEIPDLIGMLSVLAIIAGIVIVGYHGHEGTVVLLEKTKLAGGIIALSAGLCFALAHMARGIALNLGATPNTAFIIPQAMSLMAITVIFYTQSRKLKDLKKISRKSLYCYIGGGVGLLVGAYSTLIAFTMIPVWQAVAILSIQPLLILILSGLFLKQVDKISYRLVIGAFLVTLGVVSLNVY